jgi:hypothetical protein
MMKNLRRIWRLARGLLKFIILTLASWEEGNRIADITCLAVDSLKGDSTNKQQDSEIHKDILLLFSV